MKTPFAILHANIAGVDLWPLTPQSTANLGHKSARLVRIFLALFAFLVFSAPCAPAQGYQWTNFAGIPGGNGSVDGTGSAARFLAPSSVAMDSGGNVYVADKNNNTIRKVTSGGGVTTLAGLAGIPASSDGTGSAARFNLPAGVSVDGSGNVYVADQNNSIIRKVTPSGVVTTLAGLAGSSGSSDGTGSAARFHLPSSVAVNSSGIIYVADNGNSTIRKVTSTGVVDTLAGLAGSTGSSAGTTALTPVRKPSGAGVNLAGSDSTAAAGGGSGRSPYTTTSLQTVDRQAAADSSVAVACRGH